MPCPRSLLRPNRRAAALLAPLLIAAAAAACSSGSNAPAASPTPGTGATAPAGVTPSASASAPVGATDVATPPPPLPTSPAGALDPSSVQLKPDTGPFAGYTIDVPAGWVHEDVVVPAGYGRRYRLLINGTWTAQVSVICENGNTVDRLMNADSALIPQIGGTFGIGGVSDVTVAGLAGKETQYTVPLAGTAQKGGPNQETRVLYLQGTQCGWHILMQTFGTGMLARYTAIFDAVLATFKPAAA